MILKTILGLLCRFCNKKIFVARTLYNQIIDYKLF